MDQSNAKVEEFLTHYGIPGMKWGVRKRRVQTSSSSNRSRRQRIDYDDPPRQRRMSNKELQARVKRLKLEQEYAKLTARPETPSKIDRLVKTGGKIIAISGTAIAIYENMDKLAKIAKKVNG